MSETELRDVFAASALQGLLAAPNVDIDSVTWQTFVKQIADAAYDYADAMMARREA